MKIITILTLCLTASLSFAYSTLFYGERGDAFAYDDSQVCEQLCFHFTLDTAYDSYGLTNPLVDPFDFTFHFSAEVDPDIERIKHVIRKLKSKTKYGFSSVADANAYFNIHILNNTPNNQLGYLRWITYDFQISNNQHRTSTEVYQKSYFLSFGAFIIERLKDIETNIIYIFTKEDLNKVESSRKFQLWPKKYNLIPQKFEQMPYPYYISKNDLYLFNMRETYFPSEVLITIKDKDIYSLSNKTKNIQSAYFCLSIPKEYSISNNWLVENHCREFKLAPSNSIEININ